MARFLQRPDNQIANQRQGFTLSGRGVRLDLTARSRKEATSMAEQPAINTLNFIRDFESTLGALDTALTDAVRAVSAVRAFVPQISALAQVVVTIESAVTQARQMEVFPAAAPAAAFVSPAPVVAPMAPPAALRAVDPAPQIEATPEPQEERKTPAAVSQCLRLRVTKTSGPLDLKTVDNAMNEHPEIVDLALLDYDGRQATLKVWVSGSIDRQSLRQSLTDDLLQRVGAGAEVKIEFDQEPAAA